MQSLAQLEPLAQYEPLPQRARALGASSGWAAVVVAIAIAASSSSEPCSPAHLRIIAYAHSSSNMRTTYLHYSIIEPYRLLLHNSRVLVILLVLIQVGD